MFIAESAQSVSGNANFIKLLERKAFCGIHVAFEGNSEGWTPNI
jgi:hypothetical protein